MSLFKPMDPDLAMRRPHRGSGSFLIAAVVVVLIGATYASLAFSPPQAQAADTGFTTLRKQQLEKVDRILAGGQREELEQLRRQVLEFMAEHPEEAR